MLTRSQSWRKQLENISIRPCDWFEPCPTARVGQEWAPLGSTGSAPGSAVGPRAEIQADWDDRLVPIGLTCLSNLIAGKLIDVTGERPVSRIPKSHNRRRQHPAGEQASTCQRASDISRVSRHYLTCGAGRNLSKQRLAAGKRGKALAARSWLE